MTLLDQQMKKDLEERLNGEKISVAIEIGKAIKGDSISTKGLPSYFFGNRDAETIVVNLNPGEEADICDACWNVRTAGFGMSIDGFIEKYIEGQTSYGDNHGVTKSGMADSFDVKQAAFLTPWKDSGIDLSENPDWSAALSSVFLFYSLLNL